MARREAPRNPAGASLGDRIRFHAIRWVPLLVTALVTYGLFPPPAGVLTQVPRWRQRSARTVVRSVSVIRSARPPTRWPARAKHGP